MKHQKILLVDRIFKKLIIKILNLVNLKVSADKSFRFISPALFLNFYVDNIHNKNVIVNILLENFKYNKNN